MADRGWNKWRERGPEPGTEEWENHQRLDLVRVTVDEALSGALSPIVKHLGRPLSRLEKEDFRRAAHRAIPTWLPEDSRLYRACRSFPRGQYQFNNTRQHWQEACLVLWDLLVEMGMQVSIPPK